MRITKTVLDEKEWERIHRVLKVVTAPKLEKANAILKKASLPLRKQ